MTAVEPRSLLTEQPRQVEMNGEMKTMFCKWRELMLEKTAEEIKVEDAFLAGWILSNPNARVPFKEIREKDVKRDNRVQETVWK